MKRRCVNTTIEDAWDREWWESTDPARAHEREDEYAQLVEARLQDQQTEEGDDR